MKMITSFLLFFFLLACGNGGSNAEAPETEARELTTIYLVRHAEKEGGEDPELTSAGRQRAQHLRDELSGVQLAAVYSTDTRRTRATAEPTATAQQLTIRDYDSTQLSALAERLQKEHKGQTVLVVGHSNTTPALANIILGSQELADFDEEDYGNLLIVTVNKGGGAQVQRKRY